MYLIKRTLRHPYIVYENNKKLLKLMVLTCNVLYNKFFVCVYQSRQYKHFNAEISLYNENE